MTLLEALKQIRDNPKPEDKGICELVSELSPGAGPVFHQLFREWPDVHMRERAYGMEPDVTYPVGGFGEFRALPRALWHNPRRLQLLSWCIAELEKDE